jgi:N-methylhydantoinase A
LPFPCSTSTRSAPAAAPSPASTPAAPSPWAPNPPGADPGPVCYGRGGRTPTVTDADVVLGRLPASTALGGHLALDTAAAGEALEALADEMGLQGADRAVRAARGVAALADEHMAGALRVMSLDRGIDPRDAVLCCFGGAGGLHLCGIAERLGAREAMVPAHAGVLSALGMLVARPERQLSRSMEASLGSLDAAVIDAGFAALEAQGRAELAAEGHDPASIAAERSVDLRYAGQAFALNLPWPGTAGSTATEELERLAAAFADLHRARYGHELDAAVELDTLRLRLQAPTPALPDLAPGDSGGSGTPEAMVDVAGEPRPVPVFERGGLAPGTRIAGPAVIVEETSTTWLGRGWRAEVDARHNLRLANFEENG